MDFNKCGKYEIIWPYSYRLKQNANKLPLIQNGNKLEAMLPIYCRTNTKWDIFMRRGMRFTQFRHFKINHEYYCYSDYVDFLIKYISNAR